MTRIQTAQGQVEIRELRTMDEMVAAEQVQIQVWGADVSPHPKEILIPIQHEGGLLAGAFAPSGEMIGLVFSFPTRDPAIMHSQMLATVETWRGQGIGTQMKWFQRQWCLERGIQLVRWTVDPLRAANAELNIHHLGGEASTYYVDYYGTMQGIDAGAPTDRLLVEWHLSSERVAERAQRTPQDQGYPQAEAANSEDHGRPGESRTGLDCANILVRIPDHFVKLSKVDPTLALEWRMQTRELFQHYFARGYLITEFTRVGSPAYLLQKRVEEDGR